MGRENDLYFISRKLRLREPMALAQEHSASELWMSISSIQMSVLRGVGERDGPGSSSRSGAELEPKSPSFSGPEDFPEPLV